jgi:hypothetical protein
VGIREPTEAGADRELLTFLAVRLREAPVLIVGTLREELTDAVRRWLTELEHRPKVTRLRLGRMTDAEIAGLVAGTMPAGASPDHVATVVAAAEGHPLYAKELRPGHRTRRRAARGPT